MATNLSCIVSILCPCECRPLRTKFQRSSLSTVYIIVGVIATFCSLEANGAERLLAREVDRDERYFSYEANGQVRCASSPIDIFNLSAGKISEIVIRHYNTNEQDLEITYEEHRKVMIRLKNFEILCDVRKYDRRLQGTR